MEKHHSPCTLVDRQARGTGGGDGWQSYLQVISRNAKLCQWLSLGQEVTEEWKIKTTLTSDAELTGAIKCHAQGTQAVCRSEGARYLVKSPSRLCPHPRSVPSCSRHRSSRPANSHHGKKEPILQDVYFSPVSNYLRLSAIAHGLGSGLEGESAQL